ncbi:MAG: hypothetical protein ACK5R0_03590 [Bacteroidota bacterium]|jgi:hypothetical protein
MDYRTVFEVTDKGFDMMNLMPVVFIIVGLGISWFNIKYNKSTLPKKKFTIVFGFVFSGFGLIISLLTIPSSISSQQKTKEIFETKEYKIVEGEIENFNPMPYEGHAVESFTVKGVYFEYSDYILWDAFNNTASHGGPIKNNGQLVRLSYITVDEENRILKIELKE